MNFRKPNEIGVYGRFGFYHPPQSSLKGGDGIEASNRDSSSFSLSALALQKEKELQLSMSVRVSEQRQKEKASLT